MKEITYQLRPAPQVIELNTNFDLKQYPGIPAIVNSTEGVVASTADFITSRYSFLVSVGNMFNRVLVAVAIVEAIRNHIYSLYGMKDTTIERTIDNAKPVADALPKEVDIPYKEVKLLVPESIAQKLEDILLGRDEASEDSEEPLITYGIISTVAPECFIGSPDYPDEEAAIEEAMRLLKKYPKDTYEVVMIHKIATVHNEPTVTYE